MTEITSSIERSDMNALDFEKSKIENVHEITMENDCDTVTCFSPMITMMIACLADKVSNK
jgi:hypothetical protein